MEKLLLNQADVLERLGFEKPDWYGRDALDELADQGLRITYPFGPEFPRVEPDELTRFAKARAWIGYSEGPAPRVNDTTTNPSAGESADARPLAGTVAG